MPGVEIRRVESSKERMAFIRMPWDLYRNDPHWVPPLIGDQKEFLDPKRGLFFRHGDAQLFIAYRNGKPVGRISAQINYEHDNVYSDGKAFFGFFECEDDQQTANALFGAAERYLAERGRKEIEGPMNFSIYDEIGVLVDGFDTDPYVLCLHNPPYYQQLIERAGYGKSIDWYAFRGQRGTTDANLSERLKLLRDRIIKRRGLQLRQMEMSQFERDANIVKQIFHAAWDRNWGHVPMTDEEFTRIAKGIKQFIVPELSLVAELEGKPVGFALSVYDANVVAKEINGRLFPFGFIKVLANLKKTDRFRLVLMGVLPEHRNRGYEVAFYLHVIEKATSMHFNEAEMSLVVENNEPMLKSLSHLPVERYKTYRIFHKSLNGN